MAAIQVVAEHHEVARRDVLVQDNQQLIPLATGGLHHRIMEE
jgi:hypothetical protein